MSRPANSFRKRKGNLRTGDSGSGFKYRASLSAATLPSTAVACISFALRLRLTIRKLKDLKGELFMIPRRIEPASTDCDRLRTKSRALQEISNVGAFPNCAGSHHAPCWICAPSSFGKILCSRGCRFACSEFWDSTVGDFCSMVERECWPPYSARAQSSQGSPHRLVRAASSFKLRRLGALVALGVASNLNYRQRNNHACICHP